MLCGERRAENGGHHHPGAGGAAVLDQRAGPRLCWLRVQRDRRHHQLLRQFGVIDEPLALVHHSFGTIRPLHILAAISWCCALRPPCSRSHGDLMQAGASLGAGPWLTFWRIFLPLSLPGGARGSTLVFVLPSASTSRLNCSGAAAPSMIFDAREPQWSNSTTSGRRQQRRRGAAVRGRA